MRYSINYNQFLTFLNDYDNLITGIKVTKVERYGFNEMEGYQYNICLVVYTKEGYQNKRLLVHTHETYLDELETVNKETVQEYFGLLLA